MGRDSSIAWTDATLNLVMGCRKVDVGLLGGCQNCYIFRNMPRFGMDPNRITFLDLERAKRNLRSWKDQKLIFLNNYSDTFHEDIPFERIEQWHKEIIEAFPDKIFQFLTKRIGRAMIFYRRRNVPDNVWIGCSIGARNRLWRIDRLKQIDAKVRWISFEPLLEDLGEFSLNKIQWAVVGGESDLTNPRPMKTEWAENIRRICERDGAAFFFKQMGGKGGDSAGGALLNGAKYQEWPSR